ncbi:type I-E CRISPR-associated protein Cse2/CasB [Verrucosispora sp. NA02020]|uniref:type I-E CRISPR-associated protein Cse2/CasB n=1 Tax=Verrucosispora sp. NA02020 TaxID=2742132 RepID=UPI003D7333A5
MNTAPTVGQRRDAFVRSLYGLHYAVDSGNPHKSGEARRTLARLRRSFTGGRQEAEAYDVVFPHDPPEREQQVWLLVAGLFALHPQGTARGHGLGLAMRNLVEKRSTAARRFTQLLSVDPPALPHYLRQAIQLLRAEDVAVDFHRLLADLVDMQESAEQAHRTRLRWAREYHRPKRPTTPIDRTHTDPAEGVAAAPVNT